QVGYRSLHYLLREDEFGGHEDASLAVQRAMRRVSEDELYDHLRKLRDTARRHCNRRGLCVLIEKFFCLSDENLSFNWSTSLFRNNLILNET
ncbi:Uncharacterized protein FKW44_021511, partial [Caligus rogercresseyi]